MPDLDLTNLAPQPGDPWRASDHNRLVDQSVALEGAFRFEHGSAGDHAKEIFPVAGGVAVYSGGLWSLLRSHGIASISGPSTNPTIRLARPMKSAAEWGVIGQGFNGSAIDLMQAGKTADEGRLRVAHLEFYFLVVGPHAPL